MILLKRIGASALRSAIPLFLSCLPATLLAAEEAKHMGVATCASSVCHGNASSKPDANILHSEYVIWGQDDPHAGAFRTLQSPQSAGIAEKLGIGRAEDAPVCLSCHSDFVAEKRRGPRFQLSDGVGCETCHGGAEKWLKPHTERGADHRNNIGNGLVALDRAPVKAKVCQGCHIGTDEKFASHDIMGAGHPRLQFELANYSAALPEHHRVDEDYRARKHVSDAVQLWSEGQVSAALNVVDGLLGARFAGQGMWPELAFFDCHACHQSMEPVNWEPRSASAGLAPGSIRLNDSALQMVSLLLQVRDAAAAQMWNDDLVALHLASTEGIDQVRRKAKDLQRTLIALQESLIDQPLTKKQAQKLAWNMVGYSRASAFNDYMTAEQITMALNIMLRGDVAGSDEAYRAPLDALYNSLSNQHDFNVRVFRQAMDRLAGMRAAVKK
tara:strand:+ start:177285 stop:178607 length:1323 start_codon:yes stop_codon:yes gene_type:complete